MVVLNSMNDANATFGYDTKKISIIKKNFPLKPKSEVAFDIVQEISGLLFAKEHICEMIKVA